MDQSGRVFDELLVLHVQNGDRRALERLASRWQPRLLRSARRFTGDDELAREAVQECWLGITTGLKKLKDPARFPAWADRIGIPSDTPIRLLATVRGAELQFAVSVGAGPVTTVGPKLDHSILCDEAGKGEGASFTGTFLGVCCQDLTGRQRHADFERFRYLPRR